MHDDTTPLTHYRPGTRVRRAIVRMVVLVALLCIAGGGAPLGAFNASLVDTAAAAARDTFTPPVIFDTDMDFDDAAALAYLSQEHKLGHIDLRAVTVANTGAGFPRRAIYHARCILERFGLSAIPVADGTSAAPHTFPVPIRTAAEAILDHVLAGCMQSDAPSAVLAEQLIIDTVRRAPNPVTIITTGPLTNLASALRLGATSARALAAHIRRVVIMGGAVHVPGNLCCEAMVGYDNTQEVNIWIDPAAAQTVFTSLHPLRVTLIPLDATKDVPIAQSFIDRLQADHHTAEADLVVAIVNDPIMILSITAGDTYWWDPLAAIAATRDTVVGYETDTLTVMQEGPSAGRTALANQGAYVRVGISANQSRFEDIFLDTLNGRDPASQ